MRRWLVFGLSGPVGAQMLAQWSPAVATLHALSRQPQADRDGLHWRRDALETAPSPAAGYDAVVSLGPLDVFAGWYAVRGPAGGRVVALGSTSVHSKHDSPDPRERALASRLAAAEDALAEACAARGATLCLLRPTLIYGTGRDRNLSRLVALARRWRRLPLPRGAQGLRQPVHAGDVAAAVLAAATAAAPIAGRFDLPGGEALAYAEMVRRALAAGAPAARVWLWPDALFALAAGGLRLFGPGAAGPLARLRTDLVYDPAPARAVLAWDPRPFRPTPAMFPD